MRAVRFLLPLSLALATALAGCGRRGPLELPPGSAPPPPLTKSTAGATPASSTDTGLVRNTTPSDPLSRPQLVAPAPGPVVPRTPFILDPLL